MQAIVVPKSGNIGVHGVSGEVLHMVKLLLGEARCLGILHALNSELVGDLLSGKSNLHHSKVEATQHKFGFGWVQALALECCQLLLPFSIPTTELGCIAEFTSYADEGRS